MAYDNKGMSTGIDILKKQIKNNDIKPVYLFYGPEEYLKKYYVNAIEKLILEKSTRDLNRIVIEDNISASKIIDNCESYPVFSQKKMLLVKNSGYFKGSGGNKEEIEKVTEYLKNLPDYVCLIFYESEADKRLKIYKAIESEGLVVEIPYQKPADLVKWVVNVTKANGKKISMETASILVEKSSEDMTEILNEINKLIVYTGERDIIRDEDVMEVCNTSIKSRIFDLTDAIIEKDIVKTLRYLDDLITLREPIPVIIYMIARQFRQILEVKANLSKGVPLKDVAAKLKIPPFIAGRIQKQADRFSFEQLNQAICDIFECDLSIKTGKIRDKAAVEMLISKLIEQ